MPGGRPKGAINNDKRSLLAACREALGETDWHPVVEMAVFSAKTTEDTHKLGALKEVAKYVAPQLRAVEYRSAGDKTPVVNITMTGYKSDEDSEK